MRLSIIVAMDRNRLIGANNQLPWHLPADLKHFKTVTMGKPIVMGRNTHESIGKPLPGRVNIVVTRNSRYQASGCIVVRSLERAIAAAGDVDEIMIIGGAMLYNEALDQGQVQRIYLTRVDAEFEGDTWFPELDHASWEVVDKSRYDPDDKNAIAYEFITLDRR